MGSQERWAQPSQLKFITSLMALSEGSRQGCSLAQTTFRSDSRGQGSLAEGVELGNNRLQRCLRRLTCKVRTSDSFTGQDLAFLVSNKTAFELPLQKVANSNIAGRTEVSLEFATSSQRPPKGAGDELVEIRFFVPGTRTKDAASDAGSQAGDEEKEDLAVEGDETSAAQVFHDAIKEKAELGEVSGNMIINFEEVLVLTPRGRYDVDMFPDFLRLRGKTYDYKITYDGIQKLFLLPKDDQHVLFIVSRSNLVCGC